MLITTSLQSLLSNPKHRAELLQTITPEEYYNARKAEVLKVIHSEASKVKFEWGVLEHRYIDADGRHYRGFPNTLQLPIERFGEMKKFLMYLVSGISPDELDALLDVADKALHDGLKDPKNAAVIGTVLTEIRGRKKMTLHTELLLNFLAVQWVRDDEDPLVYNNQIQMQKVDALRKESEAGNSHFFFQQKELKLLSDSFRMSASELQDLWNESLKEQQANVLIPGLMKSFLAKGGAGSQKTSTNP